MNTLDEQTVLQACLTACKRQLDEWRAAGNELMVALTERDMNDMLDRLRELSR